MVLLGFFRLVRVPGFLKCFYLEPSLKWKCSVVGFLIEPFNVSPPDRQTEEPLRGHITLKSPLLMKWVPQGLFGLVNVLRFL